MAREKVEIVEPILKRSYRKTNKSYVFDKSRRHPGEFMVNILNADGNGASIRIENDSVLSELALFLTEALENV